MSISQEDIERIVRLIEASHFDEFHLELGGLKLDLRRHSGSATVPHPAVSTSTSSLEAAPPAVTPGKSQAAVPTSAAAPTSANSGLVDIKAPMLGTFFGAPKPGAEPFVTVGGRVEPDTVIGIVEVMKLMNSVNAGVSGEVVEILAPDGQLVEYDQVLIRVRP